MTRPKKLIEVAPPLARLAGIQETSYPVRMKATIDIPDELYRQVKAKSALQGRPVREVAIDLFSRWLEEGANATKPTPDQWLENWFRLSGEFSRELPPGPTATEVLEADRNRLERT